MKYSSIIRQMSLEDKVALCSGADYFHTRSFERYGIPAIRMVDGPHGIRVQTQTADHLGVHQSKPATCFPTASLTACSWDRELLLEMGAAIGEEARREGVSVVLGPGTNLKRNPLCGRNFEYFSEDPLLAGELAAGWIEGIQDTGVGASLKHFAGNNQESERMSSDSLIDERTLRELYLPAFEIAVKKARPATVMCAYNLLNGTSCSDHIPLLRDILRDEWGYAGVVLTDWGAMNDRLKAFEAGLDLEMPGSQGFFDEMVISAVRNGQLSEELVNQSVDRLLELVSTVGAHRRDLEPLDDDIHHQLARRIAAESAVLLKNDDHLLPLQRNQKIALIGAFASQPRYQGAGSSIINPTRLSSALDGFAELGWEVEYFPGYALDKSGVATGLEEMEKAAAGARNADVAVVFAGLPAEYESEGYDRASLAMPDLHNTLIQQVAAVNPHTVVVLMGGGPLEMPWLSWVKAVLNMFLSGQAGGLAVADLLTGKVNPSGKLAESYPVRYADVPSAGFYETGGKQAQYREALFVGYRYYDTAQKEVLFPFGHGLSYTNFAYSDLILSATELHPPVELNLSVTITNTGRVDGAEVVQVYVSPMNPPVYRPVKELKGFKKIYLKAGETRQVNISLDTRAFAFYDPEAGEWVAADGVFQIQAGASSRDIRQQVEVNLRGKPYSSNSKPVPTWYRNPAGQVTQADFEGLLGREIVPPKAPRKGEYSLACSFQDMKDSFIVRLIIKSIEKTIGKGLGGVDHTNPTYKMLFASATNTPLKNLSLVSPESMPVHVTTGIVHLANGRYWSGIKAFLAKSKTTKEKTL